MKHQYRARRSTWARIFNQVKRRDLPKLFPAPQLGDRYVPRYGEPYVVKESTQYYGNGLFRIWADHPNGRGGISTAVIRHRRHKGVWRDRPDRLGGKWSYRGQRPGPCDLVHYDFNGVTMDTGLPFDPDEYERRIEYVRSRGGKPIWKIWSECGCAYQLVILNRKYKRNVFDPFSPVHWTFLGEYEDEAAWAEFVTP